MSKYTAKEMFSSRYGACLKREPSPDELGLRRTSIEALFKQRGDDDLFWLDLVRMSFRWPVDEGSKEAFIKFFKEVDGNFPVVNNDNIIQTLACCVVAERIQLKLDSLSLVLPMAVLSSLFTYTGEHAAADDLITTSREFLDELISKTRKVEKFAFKRTASTFPAKIEFVNGPTTPDFVNEVKELFKKAAKDTEQLFQTQNQLEKFAYVIDQLSEETNTLWWLLGAHSRDNGLKFSKMEFAEALGRMGKELADMSTIMPGLPNIDSILSKAMEANLSGHKDTLKFSEFINAIPPDLEKDLLPHFSESIAFCCPCLSSIKSRSDFKEGERNTVWQRIAASRYQIKTEEAHKAEKLPKQLYLEIMLSKAISSK